MLACNPKLRYFPSFHENISLARSIKIREQSRLDFRQETFNLLNRTQSGTLSSATTLQNANFGLWQTSSQTRFEMSDRSSSASGHELGHARAPTGDSRCVDAQRP